jgi:hypothetical protein
MRIYMKRASLWSVGKVPTDYTEKLEQVLKLDEMEKVLFKLFYNMFMQNMCLFHKFIEIFHHPYVIFPPLM